MQRSIFAFGKRYMDSATAGPFDMSPYDDSIFSFAEIVTRDILSLRH